MRDRVNHLLILSKNADTYLQLIEAYKLPNLKIIALSEMEHAKTEGADCHIVFGEPGLIHSILPYLTKLEWIQSTWAGITPFLHADYRKDYQLTGVKDIFGPQMSEYVFCYLLMHEKQVHTYRQSQTKKVWYPRLPGQLKGKTIGILGVGSIGAHVAQTAKHFQMRTKGYTHRSTACEWIDDYYHGPQLLEFVRDLDYLVSTLPDTPNTTHLINHSVLQAMKSSAILINIGRGNAIHEEALIDALNQQTIGGAVLDVFQEEPLPNDHPLWQTPNTTITAHISAISYPEDITPIFINNYQNFINRQPLKYLIDFERGY